LLFQIFDTVEQEYTNNIFVDPAIAERAVNLIPGRIYYAEAYLLINGSVSERSSKVYFRTSEY